MKQKRILWDMPITVSIVDKNAAKTDVDSVYKYFEYVDNVFSVFKKDSEISKINKGLITYEKFSRDMKDVFLLSEKTRKETGGYFNIYRNGKYNPLGIVKGWAVNNASDKLKALGYKNFYIDAGGDVQVSGTNGEGHPWKVGIQNPFNLNENVKILSISDKGVATSGTYLRGQHIYNPLNIKNKAGNTLSLTVIGDNILEADRFATAAFAMESEGIDFIEKLKGFEGYMIDKKGIATYTSGFNDYVYKTTK